MVESAGIEAVIVFNKVDLATEDMVAHCKSIYEKIGYQVFGTNAKEGIGLAELKAKIQGKISVFAGPSGVGKSTLLNGLDPSLKLTTGQVSKKIGRGRHTTRFAQLLPFEGGYIADTPGFSNINLEELPIEDLRGSFREFGSYAVRCRFTACTHSHEPGCGVKEAVAAGKIAQSRYDSYLRMLSENVKAKERNLKK
jgi:ribosome biogenesis GTPase